MHSKIFMINIIQGNYCSICNSINLHWNNSVEQHCDSPSNTLEYTLPLYEFANKFNNNMYNASIYFKKSKLKLYVKCIHSFNYLQIYLKDTHDNMYINYIFNNINISDDIMTIKLNNYYDPICAYNKKYD